MKRAILLILTLTVILCAGCTGGAKKINYVEVNPMSANSAKDTLNATLYYGTGAFDMLVSEDRKIEAAINERLEIAVVNGLINGPEYGNTEIKRLINPKTEVESILDSGDFLFVTLSKEFLEDWELENDAQLTPDERTEMRKKRLKLAVYSITNTLIEYSGYPRVQILVDRDGSGNGKRLQLSEVGLSGEGTLEPLAWNGNIIQSVKNTAGAMLAAISNKNWEVLYRFIAYNDADGSAKLSQEEFIKNVSLDDPTVESYEIVDYITAKESGRAMVFVNINMNSKNEQARQKTNLPIKFTLENSIWKVTYSTFESLFLK